MLSQSSSSSVVATKKAVLGVAAACVVGNVVVRQIQKRFFSHHIAPTPAKKTYTHSVCGHELKDDYHWMRDESRKQPHVLNHIQKENRYANATLGKVVSDKVKSDLYDEMLSHIKEDDVNFPYRREKYFYFTQEVKGKDYSIYNRVPVVDGALYMNESKSSDTQVMLDVNKLAAGFEYFNLGCVAVSPCEEFLCYGYETDGSETYKLAIVEIASGKEVERIDVPELSNDVSWGADNKSLFYVTMDEAHRPFRAWRHELGQHVSQDEMLVEEPDELYTLHINKTRSGKFLVIRSSGSTESQNWVLELNKGENGPFQPRVRLIEPRVADMRYYVDHTRNHFFIETNADDCVNFKVVCAPDATPSKEHWRDVVPHTKDVTIADVDCFLNHVVVSFRKDAFTQVRVLKFANRCEEDAATNCSDVSMDDSFDGVMRFEDPIWTVYLSQNRRFNTDHVRVSYSSLTRPWETIDVSTHDVSEMKTLLCKEVPNYDKSLYSSERIWATSTQDNKTRIPLSAVFKGNARKPDSPVFLIGYGAYGISYDPTFSSTFLPLLDRGVVVVFAHIRGGGELGEEWHLGGKFLTKKNTFFDFIDCAKHLIASNVTSASKMVIQGASAGGLVVGNTLNWAPEICTGVVARAPFVDLINSMSDEKLPLTVGEWKEWGNPNEEKFFNYMHDYCPYYNVKSTEFPAVYIDAGLNDNRVAFWEPLKWTAKLREHNTGANPILLFMKVVGGHFGATGRYGWVRDKAREYGFVLWRLNLL